MASVPVTQKPALARRTNLLTAWSLVTGGVFFLVGGAMHPTEDLPDLSMAQQLRAMYEDPAWYPGHGAMFIGMVLITAALFALDRDPRIANVPRARTATRVTALTSIAATVGALLHLVAATDADRIGQSDSTPPLSDVYLVVETISVPLFSFSVAALAVIGALTGTLGNRLTAVLGVVGGIGYGLAGGTAVFTPIFDFLFPTALGVALWMTAAGIGLLLRRRSAGAEQAE
ncbi:hypothetical protein ACFYO0_09180 [Streptomyces sp. NPDC006365]|uniref:hypothetical protein n=1 Tax=Streptomyces sp. NPDC006365 TaxID=3364744 RepID=UPI00369D87B4